MTKVCLTILVPKNSIRDLENPRSPFLVRKSLPRYSKLQLTSTKIISQRSAVPAVVSRATKPPRLKTSRADKERLLRIAKRPRKGPFNTIVDPTEFGAGSAPIDISYAVRYSGGGDLWDERAIENINIVPNGLEIVQQRKVKVSPYGQAPHEAYSSTNDRNPTSVTREI